MNHRGSSSGPGAEREGDGALPLDASAGSDRLRLGFIGGGMMAQVGHLPFYRDDPRCVIAAIAESRPSLIGALQTAHPSARIVPDVETVLADPAIDAVVISAPRPAQAPLVEQALSAGKHVLSEKPMAHTADQARHLAGLADRRGLHYSVGFMKRYDPGVQRCRALLDEVAQSGRLGRLLLVRAYHHAREHAVPTPPHTRPRESRAARFATWPCHPDWLPAGWRDAYAGFRNVCSHDVNLLRFLLGDGLAVGAAHATAGGTVVAHLALGEVPVCLDVSRAAIGRWHEGVELVYEHGRIALSLPSPMAAGDVAGIVIEERGRPATAVPVAAARWAFAAQAAAFADALTTGRDSLSSGRDSVADIVLIEEIWRSILASPPPMANTR